MRPGLDLPMEPGDGVLMSASVVHAGSGGKARDGSERRVAFISISPQVLPVGVPSYNPRTQFHVVQYLISRRQYEDSQQDVSIENGRLSSRVQKRRQLLHDIFHVIREQDEAWLSLGHDITRFLMPSVRQDFDVWLEQQKRSEGKRKKE